jgi:hypothetical protein
VSLIQEEVNSSRWLPEDARMAVFEESIGNALVAVFPPGRRLPVRHGGANASLYNPETSSCERCGRIACFRPAAFSVYRP